MSRGFNKIIEIQYSIPKMVNNVDYWGRLPSLKGVHRSFQKQTNKQINARVDIILNGNDLKNRKKKRPDNSKT